MILINGKQYYGVIYTRINSVNGKVYVGQTTKSVEDRWNACIQEANRGQGNRLGAAIRKYGKHSFITVISYLVESHDDNSKCKNELDKMETFFILLRQSHLPENGYNCSLGGGTQSLETRQLVSVKARGNSRGSANKGKTHIQPPEAIERTRQANLGRKHSEESCIRRSISLMGKNLGKRRTEEQKQRQSMRAKELGIGKWNKGRRSKKRKAKLHICFSCFNPFDYEGHPDQVFCSLQCAHNTARKLAEEHNAA